MMIKTSFDKPGFTQKQHPQVNRRRWFLRSCAGVATGLALPTAFATSQATADRRLAFYNTHTAESVTATYWVQGEYIGAGLDGINRVLRDHRTGEVYPIDPGLLDLLHALQSNVDVNSPFSIISGYRSAKTNAMLNQNSSGVAKRSLHMRGEAVDIRLPGCELPNLRKAALALKSGGVGYYPASDFIHIDTGRVRFW
jgi:uncharacterized protein YcbK (DUF882 family)